MGTSPSTVVPRRSSPRFAKKPKDNTTSQDITPMNQLSSPIKESYHPNLNDHRMVSPELTPSKRGDIIIQTEQNLTEPSSVSFNQLSSPTQEADHNYLAFLSLHQLNNHLASTKRGDIIIPTEQNRTEPSSGPVSFNQHPSRPQETDHNHLAFLSPRQLNNHPASPNLMAAKRGDIIIQTEQASPNLMVAKRGDIIIQTEQNQTEQASPNLMAAKRGDIIIQTEQNQTEQASPNLMAAKSGDIIIQTEQNQIEQASPNLMAAKRGGIIIQTEQNQTEQSSGPNLTKMAGMCSSDSSGDEEVDSEASLVAVGAYRVRAEWAPLLRAILEKHGDIAEGCSRAQTAEWRSQFLEVCCGVVQFLREAEFARLTAGDVERKLRSVGELERQEVRVGWLRERLEDILEARKVVKRAANFKAERASRAEAVGAAEKRLRGYELEAAGIAERIRRCEIEAAAVAQRIEGVKGDLVLAHKEAEETRDFISRGRAKVKRFYKQPLADDLI